MKDGFLPTARWSPYENIVKDGKEIFVHAAAGKEIRMKALKVLADENQISERGIVSIQGAAKHMEPMVCFSCLLSWTPQCCGCYVKVELR
jgi:hypothetical protein